MSTLEQTVDQGPKRRTARGLTAATGLSLVMRVAGMGVGMVTAAILARHLAPSGYGLFSLALTLGTAAAQIADMGVTVTVSSRIAREQDAGRLLGTGLAIRTAVATAATVILIVLAMAGAFGATSDVIVITAIATPLSAASILTAGATARFRPEVSAALALIQGVLWLGAVFVVARTGASLRVLAWCFVLVVVVQTSIGLMMNRRVVPLARPSGAYARQILAASWPLAVSSLAVSLYYRFDSVILFNARGADEVGFYSAAYKFIDVAQLAPSLLVAPLLPLAAASLGGEAARRTVLFSMATRVGMVVGVGTGLMMAVLAPVLVAYLYGSQFQPAVVPLLWLALAFVGICLGWVGNTISSALNQAKAIAKVTVPVAVVSLGVQLWACNQWGAVGAAAVTAGTELVVGVSMCLLAARAMDSRLPLRPLVSVLAVGVAVAVGALLVDLPWWVEGVVAAAVFAAAVLGLRAITVADVKRVLSGRSL
jgi:O-antigen/teichoic acid export membrane protein